MNVNVFFLLPITTCNIARVLDYKPLLYKARVDDTITVFFFFF